MGQNSTIVANAYNTPVYVKVDAERSYATMESVAMSVGSDR